MMESSRKFSLIELIAVLIILSVITVASLSFFTDTLMMGVKVRNREHAMQKGQVCEARIRKELLVSDRPVILDSGATIKLGGDHSQFIKLVDENIEVDDVVLLDNVYLKTGDVFAQTVNGRTVVTFTIDVEESSSDLDFSFVVTPRN